MILLDGKSLSQKILLELKSKLDNYSQKPNLDIILVGDDPASVKYVQMKQLKALGVGIGGNIHTLDKNCSTSDVLSLVNKLNNDPTVTGFMVQLPLPSQIDTETVLEAINPLKDADGLTSKNLGLLFHKNPQAIAAATSLGVIRLLEEYDIDFDGKNAVIIGRSEEIGMPLMALTLAKNATVTVCHSHTKNLQEICQKADILITSVGKSKLITKDFVKPDAVIVDVGLSLDPETNKLVGDVDFEEVSKVASYITPVPGGIGPMTISSLLSNTVKLWEIKNNL